MIRIKINTDTKSVELLEDTSIRKLGEIQKIIKALDPKGYKEWKIEPSTIELYKSPYWPYYPYYPYTYTKTIDTTGGPTTVTTTNGSGVLNMETGEYTRTHDARDPDNTDEDISRN